MTNIKERDIGGMTTATGFIEKTYPETAKEFQRLQFEQYSLFCKKQMDYGGQLFKVDNWMKL